MLQIITAGVVSFLVAIFFTPYLIKRFSAEGLGQEIREEGPKSHLRKRVQSSILSSCSSSST